MATARKKGKGFELRASFGYDSKGKQIRKSKMWNPPPGMTDKQIEKELVRQTILFEEELRGGSTKNGCIKLSDFIELWKRDYAKPQLARKTYENYLVYLPRITNALGHLKLSDIQPVHINRFYTNLSEEGIKKRRTRNENGKLETERKLSDRTRRDYHKLLSNILNWAVRWQYVERNMASFANPPKLTYKESKYLSDDETRRLLSLLKGEPVLHRTMIYLLVFAGLRRGELLGLKWSDINFENQTIKIERNLQYFYNNDYLIKQPKTAAGIRSFTIGKSVCTILTEYKAWQNELKQSVGDQWNDLDYIFTRPDGRPYLPESLTQWFGRFSKHNLPKVTLHSLRHTNATLLIGSGIDVTTTSKRLGHANSSITLDIYSHFLESSDSIAAEKLDEILIVNDEKLLKISDFEHLKGKTRGKEQKSS